MTGRGRHRAARGPGPRQSRHPGRGPGRWQGSVGGTPGGPTWNRTPPGPVARTEIRVQVSDQPPSQAS